MAINNDTFNKDLDKVTEAELVYDIVERLRLGKDLEIPNNGINKVIFLAKTLLLDVLKFILTLLPPSLVFDRENIVPYILTIKAGEKNKSVTLDGNLRLYRAYSDKVSVDISSALSISYNEVADMTTVSLLTDTAYPYSDIISIYLKKN